MYKRVYEMGFEVALMSLSCLKVGVLKVYCAYVFYFLFYYINVITCLLGLSVTTMCLSFILYNTGNNNSITYSNVVGTRSALLG